MNKFWIGVSLMFVAAVALLLAVVVPQARRTAELKQEVRTLTRSLEAARPGTPSREDIGSWKRYGSDLSKATREITSFYAEKDRHFERWFPGLTPGSKGSPSRDVFVARHRDEMRILEDDLRRESVTVGPVNEEDRAPGFNWEKLTIQQLDAIGPADESAVLRRVQKRFWARRRIADLALEGRVRIRRIVDFRFFEPLHPRIRTEAPLGGGSEKVVWPGLELTAPGLPPNFQETPLEGGLGRTFTFGVVLQLPMNEVPRVINELLDPGRDLLMLIGSEVSTEGPPVQITVPFNKDEDKDEDFLRRARELRKTARPRDVMLVVTCRILDLELSGSR